MSYPSWLLFLTHCDNSWVRHFDHNKYSFFNLEAKRVFFRFTHDVIVNKILPAYIMFCNKNTKKKINVVNAVRKTLNPKY